MTKDDFDSIRKRLTSNSLHSYSSPLSSLRLPKISPLTAGL
jgi:hypothetical protein